VSGSAEVRVLEVRVLEVRVLELEVTGPGSVPNEVRVLDGRLSVPNELRVLDGRLSVPNELRVLELRLLDRWFEKSGRLMLYCRGWKKDA